MAKKRREQGSGSPPVSAERRKITPVDIQQKEFRLEVRGYNERDVDQFLDEVEAELEEGEGSTEAVALRQMREIRGQLGGLQVSLERLIDDATARESARTEGPGQTAS